MSNKENDLQEPKRRLGMRRIEPYSKEMNDLIETMQGRIRKWTHWQNHPEEFRHGDDPEYFKGFCEGRIREAQAFIEILIAVQKGENYDWAKVDKRS